jgi:hypothetical protein
MGLRPAEQQKLADLVLRVDFTRRAVQSSFRFRIENGGVDIYTDRQHVSVSKAGAERLRDWLDAALMYCDSG